jgi:O-antigen/teichoic acid export membrane protein
VFLMLPGIAFIGVYYIGESLLNIGNKTFFIGAVVTVSTLLSIALNYLLIPLWGIYGAILVFNGTLIFIAFILMTTGMKVFPIQLERIRLVMIGGLFFLFMFLVFVLRGVNPFVYYSVIPTVGCVTLAFLYFSNFCEDQEKALIRRFLQVSRSRTSQQKPTIE